MRITKNKGLTFDDVLLSPKYSDIKSRKKVSTTVDLKGLKLKIPIISSPMDTVTEEPMARKIAELGGLGIIHRFMPIEKQVEQVKNIKKDNLLVGAAIGVKEDDFKRAMALWNAGVDVLCIDVAHGHHNNVKEMMVKLNNAKASCEIEQVKYPYIIAGNVATRDGVLFLKKLGVDAVKVGIGPGCFAAGTRILMSNGLYKNIEDVKPGDRVINKDGDSVSVLRSFCTGKRTVSKLESSSFYSNTYLTSDHKFLIGDFGSVSKNTLSKKGYSDTLDRKTSDKKTKFKWKEISKLDKDVLLVPRKINFELNSDFKISTKDNTYVIQDNNDVTKSYISSSYELGYIFGTFISNGLIKKDKDVNKNTAVWKFSLDRQRYASKLLTSIYLVFNTKVKLYIKNKYIHVKVKNKKIVSLLSKFKETSAIPEELIVTNKIYISGLYDGMVDANSKLSEGKVVFLSNSGNVIEFFNLVNYLMFGYFPLNSKTSSIPKDKFCAREIYSYKNRFTKDYFIIKDYFVKETKREVDVYDLEVDCYSHSFVANNMIVHNSVCSTREVTGYGIPQFSAIVDCIGHRIPIIADGGIRKSSDIAKAIAAGASAVMLGSLLAGSDESPGTLINDMFGTKSKQYRGMASFEAQLNREDKEDLITKYVSEGISTKIPHTGPIEDTIHSLIGGLKSAMSYEGAKNIREFQEDPEFVIITPNAKNENKPHINTQN